MTSHFLIPPWKPSYCDRTFFSPANIWLAKHDLRSYAPPKFGTIQYCTLRVNKLSLRYNICLHHTYYFLCRECISVQELTEVLSV